MRQKNKRRRRRAGNRSPSRTILVVCEGKTEPIYLNALKRELGLRTVSITIEKEAGNHSGTVITAKRLRDKRAKDAVKSDVLTEYDEVWCVFDVENPQHHLGDLKRAIVSAEKEKFKLALSNPSFEVWYLFHFTRGKYLKDGQSAKQTLKQHLPNYSETANLFTKLYPRTPTAMHNAVARLANDDLDQPLNPSTHIHKLLCQAFFGNQIVVGKSFNQTARCFFKIEDVPRCAYCHEQALREAD